MKYEKISQLTDDDFKRLSGITHKTFKHILCFLQSLPRFGRPTKLCLADQMLMTLMYWREYRTQFHIAQTFGVSEATVCRTIRKIEDKLIKSGQFRLPGKKKLLESDTTIEVVIVDATEQPIERPKKTEKILQWEKRKTYS